MIYCFRSCCAVCAQFLHFPNEYIIRHSTSGLFLPSEAGSHLIVPPLAIKNFHSEPCWLRWHTYFMFYFLEHDGCGLIPSVQKSCLALFISRVIYEHCLSNPQCSLAAGALLSPYFRWAEGSNRWRFSVSQSLSGGENSQDAGPLSLGRPCYFFKCWKKVKSPGMFVIGNSNCWHKFDPTSLHLNV